MSGLGSTSGTRLHPAPAVRRPRLGSARTPANKHVHTVYTQRVHRDEAAFGLLSSNLARRGAARRLGSDGRGVGPASSPSSLLQARALAAL